MTDAAKFEVLVERFFTGAADAAQLDRFASATRAASAEALRADRANHLGEAWLETLDGKPDALAAWVIAKTLAPRPYVPRQLVGTWTEGANRCELAFDGSATDTVFGGATRWCVHRKARREDLTGEELWLDGGGKRVVLPIEQAGPQLIAVPGHDLRRTAVARSSVEMEFCMSLDRCSSCGTRALGDLKIFGDENAWMYGCTCPECGHRRAHRFATAGTPYEATVKAFELGEGASQLIAPAELRAELARLTALVDPQPTKLAPAPWNTSRDALMRAITCATELAKLGTSTDIAKLQAILADYTADGPRMHRLEKGAR